MYPVKITIITPRHSDHINLLNSLSLYLLQPESYGNGLHDLQQLYL